MGLLSDLRLRSISNKTKNVAIDSELISKNLITMGKHLEEQNSVIISRLDDICKMLYDIAKKDLDK